MEIFSKMFDAKCFAREKSVEFSWAGIVETPEGYGVVWGEEPEQELDYVAEFIGGLDG